MRNRYVLNILILLNYSIIIILIEFGRGTFQEFDHPWFPMDSKLDSSFFRLSLPPN